MSKKNKKIKLFLGAYVNFPNAQNINCDHIAKYIDKEKFEVHTMYTDKMPINKQEYKKLGIHLHRLIHHRFIWYWCKWLTMFFGKYDIYYLPKVETVEEEFAKRFRKKIYVCSIEGVVGEQISIDNVRKSNYRNNLMNSYFSISNCIRDSVKKYWGRDSRVIYLGLDAPQKDVVVRKNIKTIIWIGSVIDRKRPEIFVDCARTFPQLDFVMIGDGDKQDDIKKQIKKENIMNLQYLGRIANDRVYNELRKADLLLMTSDKEGLPKVIGEAMVSGVPAIYINEYYDVDYVVSGVNGYAVKNKDEMIEKIQFLLDNPTEFENMSQKAIDSVQDYLWPVLIKDYEQYFLDLYSENKR